MSRGRDRVLFVVALIVTLLLVYAFRATGPLSLKEQMEANEGR